jgi:serine/threonine protein kinase
MSRADGPEGDREDRRIRLPLIDFMPEAVARPPTYSDLDDVTPHDCFARPHPLPSFRVHPVIDGCPEGGLPGGLRVLDQLGETGEGSIYRAEYPSGVEVALVILGSPEHPGDPATLARMREWFERAIRIRHPNVAAVHEMGDTEAGLVYLVAECLIGELLSETLARRGTLPLDEALDLCRQAAAGLEAAHQVGCFHGNLSPDTILLTAAPGGQPQVKLIHFAQPSSMEVSPEYASPERIAGDTPDERSDVFSLAAVFHHLITGGPPGVVGEAGPITGALGTALSKALAPEPDRRFRTIPEFAASVERAGAVATRSRSPMTRRARVLGAAAALLALVLTGLWLYPSSQGSVESAALRVSGAATRALEVAAAPPSRPVPPPATRPVPSPPLARREASHPARAPAPAPLPTKGSSEKRPQSRAAGSIGTSSRDSIGTSPIPVPTPPTWETRAQVYSRIGLDEAARVLGGPVHAIEGISPMFIGLASGQPSDGPVVRVVYLDPNGRLILLDQQKVRAGQAVPPATGDRWPIGNVLVSLHGEVPPQTISNLRVRVR